MDLIADFAAEVGPTEPVVAVGGRTQFSLGGPVDPSAREVRAPSGIVEHEPAEMTVRVRAGTTVLDLDDALEPSGQCVALPAWRWATVGGVLAAGQSGLRRLGYGPVRDTLLEARAVTAAGTVVKAGGPTVKNVSGYDLCRLLVGSLGTLALLAEVVLRTRPLPAASRWLAGETDPFELRRWSSSACSILWDGTTTWALLEGHPRDLDVEAARSGLAEVAGPPALPPHRHSMVPSALRGLGSADGPFVAEVGVGIVHREVPPPLRAIDPASLEVHRRLKAVFDPGGRLAPGRSVLVA